MCERKHWRQLTQTIQIVGVMFGAMCFTSLSDYFGRKPIFLFSQWALVVVGVANAFSPNYYIYTALRFIIGALQQVYFDCLRRIRKGTEIQLEFRGYNVQSIVHYYAPISAIRVRPIAGSEIYDHFVLLPFLQLPFSTANYSYTRFSLPFSDRHNILHFILIICRHSRRSFLLIRCIHCPNGTL